MEIPPQSSSASTAVASYPFSLELPPDVVINVLAFSDPADILSMRKTCRVNYKTTKLRAVWLTALDRICDRYGIFKPTYPQNSMTISELEHASLSPHLFMNLFGDVSACLAYQTRILHGRTRKPGSEADEAQVSAIDVVSVHIVPGGRFLITAGCSADSRLCLWDVGYNAYARMKLRPIAKLLQPITAGAQRRPNTIYGVAPSSDGRNLVIATQVPLNVAQDKGIINIYRIDPCSADPKFRLEGQLDCKSSNLPNAPPITVGYACLTHDYLFVYYIDSANDAGAFFVLWNWNSGTGIKWRVDLSRRLESDSIYVSERSIIVCYKGKVLVWDVPPFQPITNTPSQNRQHTNNIPLVTNMPKDIEQTLHPQSLCGTSIWQRREVYQSDERVCLFDRHAPGISMYAIQRTPRTNPSFLPCGTRSPKRRYNDSAISPLFNIDGHLVYCTASGARRLVAAAIPLLPPSTVTDDHSSNLPPAEQFQYMSIRLTDDDERGLRDTPMDSVGFCPMSGRFVYFWGDESDLRISDFLLPPD